MLVAMGQKSAKQAIEEHKDIVTDVQGLTKHIMEMQDKISTRFDTDVERLSGTVSYKSMVFEFTVGTRDTVAGLAKRVGQFITEPIGKGDSGSGRDSKAAPSDAAAILASKTKDVRTTLVYVFKALESGIGTTTETDYRYTTTMDTTDGSFFSYVAAFTMTFTNKSWFSEQNVKAYCTYAALIQSVKAFDILYRATLYQELIKEHEMCMKMSAQQREETIALIKRKGPLKIELLRVKRNLEDVLEDPGAESDETLKKRVSECKKAVKKKKRELEDLEAEISSAEEIIASLEKGIAAKLEKARQPVAPGK